MIDHATLTLIWFVLLGVLLIGYAVLDGFDFGVGIVHPFVARNDTERRLTMNSIGPLWDGNEVWLVTFGGALFAAFPNAYATVFSGFYSAFMLLLFALIFRAVSLEFRSKVHNRFWRSVWDWAFFGASLVAALLFGVAGGNLIAGMAINEAGDYTGIMLDQLWSPTVGPYPLVIGFLTVALFAMHGSIYLYLKTEGELQRRVHATMWRTFGIFLVLYIFATMYTLQAVPGATENFRQAPWLWIVPVLNVLAIANIPRAIHLGRPMYAFLSSCATIAALATLFAAAIFPNFVPSTIDSAYSVSIFNARSSEKTLGIMLIIALIGMPCVLSYTVAIYWTFRGKVTLDRNSY